MPQPKSFLRVFTETGPLIALAVAVALLDGIVGPASAQFFNFGGPPQRPQPRSNGGFGCGGVGGGGGGVGGFGGGGGWFGVVVSALFQQQAQRRPPPVENYSKAPPPEKRETVPE